MKGIVEDLKGKLLKLFGKRYDTEIRVFDSPDFSICSEFPPNDPYCETVFSEIYKRFAKKREDGTSTAIKIQ